VRVGVGGDEAQVSGRELPVVRVPVGFTARLQLLDVRDLADVDFLGEVAADGVLERLAFAEVAAREGPSVREGLAGALPQQHAEAAIANLQDDGERDVGRTCAHARLVE
jgi:hypothetical protein